MFTALRFVIGSSNKRITYLLTYLRLGNQNFFTVVLSQSAEVSGFNVIVAINMKLFNTCLFEE